MKAAREEAMDEARSILEPLAHDLAANLDLAEVLPVWIDSQGSGEVEQLHACSDIYRPAELSQQAMLTVLQLDLSTGEVGSTGLMADGWTVYATASDLFIAQSSWWSWWGGADEELSTTVHQFSLHADGAPVYEASGDVPGWVYDQFAMSYCSTLHRERALRPYV